MCIGKVGATSRHDTDDGYRVQIVVSLLELYFKVLFQNLLIWLQYKNKIKLAISIKDHNIWE